jgi:hypothetical protein
MNSLTVLLGACSVAFAASTAYLITRSDSDARGSSESVPCHTGSAVSRTERGEAEYYPRAQARADTQSQPAAADTGDVLPLLGRTSQTAAPDINQAMDTAIRNEQRELLKDSDYRLARREIEKQHLWQSHREATDAMGLSLESTDALIELLAEHRLQSLEHPLPGPRGGDVRVDPSNPPAWLAAQRVEEERRQADIRALLGDAKYAEWTTYRETAAARREVALLGREFELSGDPLRLEQREALTRAILDEEREQATASKQARNVSLFQSADRADHVVTLEENVESVQESNVRLQRAAAKHLSSQQMQLYDSVLQRRIKLARAQLKVQREMLERRSFTSAGDH